MSARLVSSRGRTIRPRTGGEAPPREGGFQVAAAHFNHHLRPTADRDQGFVTGWCGAKGIPLTCGGADAAAYAKEAGTSLEDGARQLRYRFLEETADRVGAARIATAHGPP